MPMAVTARRFTVDEVLAWPDDGNRYELVDGVLLVTPAPIPLHQVVAARLTVALEKRIRPWPDVHVGGPGEIRVQPGTLMEPDILVFRSPSLRAKWETIHEHWLAVEVWSPSSVVYDRDVKRDAYLQIGVREVWLVDAERKTVFVSRLDGPRDLPHRTTLPWRPFPEADIEPLDLADVFRGVD
ncbi:MAG TPA: Uma2 family endonuclease [Gemmatimonadales bacterium]|nr:Uma2 family endonuclease [Gemmatimonadales bacterium]